MPDSTLIRPTTEAPVKFFKPSELIGIFNNALSRQNENAQVVYLRGVYLQKQNQGNWAYCYDILRDEDSQEEITIQLTQQQRSNLKNGNLVMVGGILGRNVSPKGFIQLTLKVSRIELVQEQAIDEQQIKRMELRQKKAAAGFKTVDSILEQALFSDKHPRVALLFAQTSITMSDFNAGINAAKSAIDFMEYRANFSNSKELIATLQNIDENWFDVIAIVRGGGGGIEKLDDLSVLETIISLKTPIIAAIGHVEENIFIKQLVDKSVSTPNGLGQYFSEMVESVSEKKTKSRAALTEQIKKQFQQQLEAGQKQNKELQERITALTKQQAESTKQQEEANKKHAEQVEAAQKQNKTLQEQLGTIQKGHKEQLEKINESQVKLQTQLKEQTELNARQAREFNEGLKKMQDTNGQLQKSLTEMTAQNAQTTKAFQAANNRAAELEKQLSEKGGDTIWKIVAILAVIICILLLIFK